MVQSLAATEPHCGAIAFSRTGDPALGDFEDAVILKTVGEVDEGLLNHIGQGYIGSAAGPDAKVLISGPIVGSRSDMRARSRQKGPTPAAPDAAGA